MNQLKKKTSVQQGGIVPKTKTVSLQIYGHSTVITQEKTDSYLKDQRYK